MPNPYHDETGRFCSKGEMGEAVERLFNHASDTRVTQTERHSVMNQWFSLKQEYEQLGASDATGPAVVSNNAQLAKVTPIRPGVKTAQVTGPVKKTVPPVAPINTIDLPANHTYKPAGGSINPNGYGRGYVGAKASNRDIKLVAKDVRADIEEAQAKGYLPKNLTYGVKIDRYAGGQSLNVTVMGVKDKDLYKDKEDHRRTDKAQELAKRVQGIVEAYRTDDSNSQVDYFNVNFYGHVTIEDEHGAAWREAEAAKQKARTQGYAQRKVLGAAVARSGGSPAAYFEQNYKFTNSTADGEGQFAVLDGPTPMIVVRHASRLNGDNRYDLYDLSSYSIEADLETSLKAYKLPMFQRRFGKFRFSVDGTKVSHETRRA